MSEGEGVEMAYSKKGMKILKTSPDQTLLYDPSSFLATKTKTNTNTLRPQDQIKKI